MKTRVSAYGLVVNGDRILLTQLAAHCYRPGQWTLPGGGMDHGELPEQTLQREFLEETGLIARAAPRLVSLHANERFFPGDHVAVFVIDAFDRGERTSHGEIAEVGWFAPDALPADVNRGCRARLAEWFDGVQIDTNW